MLEDIIQERLKKRDNLVKAGLNPYPARVSRTNLIKEVSGNFFWWSLLKKNISVVGRVMGFRNQGGVFFLDLQDESGKIQAVGNEQNLKDFKLFRENLDIGDFVAVSGYPFKTKKGQQSILIKNLTVAVKALRPLPSQWYGLKDVEERFRKRYLDFILNPEVKEKIQARFKLVSNLRAALNQEGFLEVETPMLQPVPGGARAKPFKTHHNALDADFYLRIAPELYLKRLLVGGFEKVFEIGRNFRNEGMDRDHNPEFSELELYWAYQDYNGLMIFLEKLLKPFISGQWEKVTFGEIFKRHSGKDYKSVSPQELDEVFKHQVRPKIENPTWVIDYPESIMPLAKFKPARPGEGQADLTESFQLIVRGAEIVKGFSEMNNPAAQRAQMEQQEKEFRAGNEESSRLDEDFLEALEYGMPPAAGVGIGIDRLVSLITKAHAVKEIIIFPTLKPKETKDQ